MYEIFKKINHRKCQLHAALTFLHLLDFLLLLINGGAQQGEDDTSLRVDADSGDQHFTAALHDVCAGQDHRIECFAFFHMIRFASQRGLINLQLRNRVHVNMVSNMFNSRFASPSSRYSG
jgi:hypothetical protein